MPRITVTVGTRGEQRIENMAGTVLIEVLVDQATPEAYGEGRPTAAPKWSGRLMILDECWGTLAARAPGSQLPAIEALCRTAAGQRRRGTGRRQRGGNNARKDAILRTPLRSQHLFSG